MFLLLGNNNDKEGGGMMVVLVIFLPRCFKTAQAISQTYVGPLPSSVNKKPVRPNSFAVRPPAPKILSMTYHFFIDHTKKLIDHTKN